jgi:hypothetical protein
METFTLSEKKRKIIDLPVDDFRKLSIVAASQGTSLKAFIENILVSKAKTLNITVSENPSPSGDTWFDSPENREEVERRLKKYQEGKTKTAAILGNREDIKNFMNSL